MSPRERLNAPDVQSRWYWRGVRRANARITAEYVTKRDAGKPKKAKVPDATPPWSPDFVRPSDLAPTYFPTLFNDAYGYPTEFAGTYFAGLRAAGSLSKSTFVSPLLAARAVLARYRKLGLLRRACRHPAASRNTYRSRRAARDVARRQLGLWPRKVDASHRGPRQERVRSDMWKPDYGSM